MDSIGLGISKTKLMYFKMGTFPIKGIVCSTNDIGLPKTGILNLDCFSMARGNPGFNGGLYSNVKAFCPENCGNRKKDIWGSYLYRDDSSICRAAIHAGAIKNKHGGLIIVSL